jgi:hypothetical protein
MSTIVIMPGGFHPFHAGHAALYDAARQAFPGAEVYVAATNDTSTRPFPFQIKEKLAKLAGVEPGHFVQVKSPFRAEEITSKYNPEQDNLIFVRSEKDAASQPKPGGVKKDGTPSYLQPLKGNEQDLQPFSKHAYMAYLPTVEFTGGMTSASEIRAAWPKLNDKRKMALVMSLYPATQKNPKLAATVVKMLDSAIAPALDENMPVVGGQVASYQAQDHLPPELEEVEAYGFVYNRRDQREMWRKVFPSPRAAQQWADSKNAVIMDMRPTAPELDENLSRRGFLRGLGAAAAAGATGSVMAQTMPNVNAQQVELAKKYYNALVQRAKEDGRELDRRTLNFLKAKADEAAAQKFQQSKPQQGFPAQGSERRVAKDAGQFESQPGTGMTTGYQRRENWPVDEDYIDEKWSQKYKSSINCANPKGFSQRAHCAGRKK